MIRRAPSSWSKHRHVMTGLAERLTAEFDDKLPTDLGRVAKSRAVRLIEFCPLLVDGGLSVVQDGFSIFVRSEASEAKEFTKLFAEDGTGKLLPVSVAKRVRYTIAHEIAHTLLFDIETFPPQPKIRPKKGMGIRGLEHACNDLAGVLLLPQTAVLREASNPNRLMDPNYLRDLCDKALVSRANLVNRLAHIKNINLPAGIIASAKETESGWRLTAITRHYTLRDMFPKVTVGSFLDDLIGESAYLSISVTKTPTIIRVAKYKFECLIETKASGYSKRSSFVTLRRLESVD